MADDFLADGIVVRDEFVSPGRVQELIECAAQRRARGEFSAGSITVGSIAAGSIAAAGVDERGERHEAVRGDSTCWLAPPWCAAEQWLLRDFEQLRLDLNSEAFLGLFDLELHYAWYPPGAGYARHVDQPKGRAHRQVSLILYLNQDWTPEAGGALRLFGADQHRDIEPIAGRLVYFLCAGREHAVLPTQTGRLSICGWFRRRPEDLFA